MKRNLIVQGPRNIRIQYGLSLGPDFLIHRRPRAGIHLTYVGTTFRGALSLMVAGKEHAILLPKARGQMWTTSFYITVAGSVIAGVA